MLQPMFEFKSNCIYLYIIVKLIGFGDYTDLL